jgi:hypothetical protein
LDILEVLVVQGVCDVELEHEVRVEDMLDARDHVLRLTLRELRRLGRLEHRLWVVRDTSDTLLTIHEK